MMVLPDGSYVCEAGQGVPMFGRHCSIVLCQRHVTCKEIRSLKNILELSLHLPIEIYRVFHDFRA